VEWSTGAHFRLLYAVGHATTFVVNAALVAGQLAFPCTHPDAEHEAGQPTKGVGKIFQ